MGCAVLINGPPGTNYARLEKKLKKVEPKKYALLRDSVRDYASSAMAQYHAPSGQWFVIDPQGVIQAQGDDLDKAAHALSEVTGKPVVKLPPMDSFGGMFMGGGMAPPEAVQKQNEPTDEAPATGESPSSGLTDKTKAFGDESAGSAVTGNGKVPDNEKQERKGKRSE